MAAILDFTDVKNLTEGREGGKGTRLGTAPYGRLLLAPVEGWRALRALWIAVKKKKKNWTPIFFYRGPPYTSPPAAAPPTPCRVFF